MISAISSKIVSNNCSSCANGFTGTPSMLNGNPTGCTGWPCTLGYTGTPGLCVCAPGYFIDRDFNSTGNFVIMRKKWIDKEEHTIDMNISLKQFLKIIKIVY